MRYKFHPKAYEEFELAIDFYEGELKNLGEEFATEIHQAIKRIIDFPEAWHPMTQSTRRCLVNRFPFGVVYRIQDSVIIIVSVMHLSRKPDYWLNRI